METSNEKFSARRAFLKLKMSSNFSDQFIMSTAIAIVLTSFLFMISGCSYYRISARSNPQPDTFLNDIMNEVYPEKKYPREFYLEGDLEKLFFQQRDIYVIDSKGRWHLNNPELTGDSIIGKAQLAPVPEVKKNELPETRKSRRYKPSTESDIIKRINLYVDNLILNDSGTAYIPVASIDKCEIYKKDKGKTAGAAIGTFFIFVGAAFGVILIIAVLTSCPFVYAFDGNAYQFIGEIYGGAVYPSLERDDYLAMPKYGTGSDYRVKIANMLQEIQYINQADLLILTHDSAVFPLVDKYGDVQTISNPVLPYEARDSKGNDCLDEITAKDMVTCNFSEEPDTSGPGNYLNSLELTFMSNSNPDSAKIYINGKNSLWGDHMIREFFNLFGKRYPKFVRRQEEKPAGFHQEWMLQQGLPLQVYVMKDREWQLADYFNMVGALGNRDMVLPLDLQNAWSAENPNNASEYTLRVKLVSGFMFWEVDYAAIDISENAEVRSLWLSPDNAVDQNGKSVGNLLASDDDHYLVQKETGDEVILDFTLPGSIDPSYTVYLHSKGYYQQAGKSKSEPDIALLETFREPGRLSLWSWQKMSEAKTDYQSRLDRQNVHK